MSFGEIWTNPDNLWGLARFNETRKRLLLATKSTLEPPAAYYPGDVEIYLTSGWRDSRMIWVARISLGGDPLEELKLTVDGDVVNISS